MGPQNWACRPIYYGWWVLAATAAIEMLAIGSTSYSAGLFVLPLEREFSLGRAAVNSPRPDQATAVLPGKSLNTLPNGSPR